MSAPSHEIVSRFRRFCAVTAAGLLLLLAVSAASPSLHHWLHGDGSDDASDNCAVVLFATGVTLAAAALAVTAPRLAWRETAVRFAAPLFLTSPRYLRQPERGPPGC